MQKEESPLEELEKEPETPVIETEEKKEEEVSEEKVKAKKRLSDRNRELTRNWREEQRKNQALEERLNKLEEQNRLKEEPNPDNYDDLGKLKEDNARWNEQERQRIREEERQAIKKEQEQKNYQRKIEKSEALFSKTSREYLEKDVNYKGYIKEIQDVCADYETPDIQELIIEAEETGPEVITYLGNNPDELEEIANLSPARRIARMGRLIGKLEAKPVKKGSSAPDPVRSVVGSAPRQSAPKAANKHTYSKGETFAQRAKRLNGR